MIQTRGSSRLGIDIRDQFSACKTYHTIFSSQTTCHSLTNFDLEMSLHVVYEPGMLQSDDLQYAQDRVWSSIATSST